ncbi:hypothetical protein KI387_021213 [Taxus chinensis]|uniref:Germin-like protein n=1 Tax=Taxus chinensis TaxID=29808 RepID=A0AA38LC58_TAXCH|nr:hypothetical protein KI387_021213 [Taxus chinensis]
MNTASEKTVINCLLWLSIMAAMASASDPDPLQDFCVADLSSGVVKVNGFACKDSNTVKASDFLFRGLNKSGSTNSTFSSKVTSGSVQNFPGLNTLGISMNRVDFAPGGINPPHTHPHATEIVYLMKGTIIVGFVTTNNVLFSQKLEKGDVFVIPRGLMHFQQNTGSSKAVALSAFNSQMPSVQILPFSLFGSSPAIPDDVLAKAFQISYEEVKNISSKSVPS